MERQKFEDSFQDIFRNAEEEPSSSVWTNIELDLERLEAGKMKRRILFYQWVAAASIFFAVASAGAFYFYTSGSNTEHNTLANARLNSGSDEKGTAQSKDAGLSDDEGLDKNKTIAGQEELQKFQTQRVADQNEGRLQTKDSNASNAKSQHKRSSDRAASNRAMAKDQLSGNQNQLTSSALESTLPIGHTNNGGNNVAVVEENSKLLPPNASGHSTTDQVAGFRNKNLTPLYVSHPVELSLPEEEKVVADPGQLLLQRLAYEEKMLNADKDEKTKKDERIWTSVGFAAGSFNNVGSGTQPQVSNSPTFQSSIFSRNSVSNQAQPNGSSYSFGVNVGGKIATRWTLQGGINYLTQSSDYTSNALIVADQNFEAPALVEKNSVPSLDFSNIVTTSEYSINNNLQFFSLPVMAGYLIIDRDFGWQLSTGISTDLFIQNVLTPDNENLSKTTNGRGDESPYRPFNLSGLVGTEFSYRVANRYRIALNPGIRYPFNSIYKSEVGINTTPLTFDVALKFKYIFQ